jgi:hypothetical protein
VGDRRGTARSLCLLAKVIAAQGDNTRARALYEESLALLRALGCSEYMALCLEGLGVVVAAQKPGSAVRLWGAAEALRAAIGAPIPPIERASYEQAVAAARTELGESDFAAAWAQGRATPLEQVISTVLKMGDEAGKQ